MKLGIVGTGLIGGSIGLRARELGWNVSGFDADPAAARAAQQRGAIDWIAERDALYRDSQILVIAAPPRATVRELEQLRAHAPSAKLIIDVASVKVPVVDAAGDLLRFVGTHPLAGSERAGAAAADAALFQGKTWLYISPSDSANKLHVEEFIGAMGARAVPTDAAAHDRMLALTSHLPQLLATLFTKSVRQQHAKQSEDFFGPVARELVRLGNSSPTLWREIFAYNGANIAAHARELAAQLEAAARALADEAADEKTQADERRTKPDRV
ncbi:MAG TPA: prephenate dehydrogenase [Candidatus Rubrimentiphilum sp.]|nr:prephenate dehydrogenase [Candidatus Rubrimentiphilum sp.]